MKEEKIYVGARGNGKPMIGLYQVAINMPSYTAYREFVRAFGGKPRSWLRFKVDRLRRKWFIKQIEWRINHDPDFYYGSGERKSGNE